MLRVRHRRGLARQKRDSAAGTASSSSPVDESSLRRCRRRTHKTGVHLGCGTFSGSDPAATGPHRSHPRHPLLQRGAVAGLFIEGLADSPCAYIAALTEGPNLHLGSRGVFFIYITVLAPAIRVISVDRSILTEPEVVFSSLAIVPDQLPQAVYSQM